MFVLTLAVLFGSFGISAFASDDSVRITTNGAAANYAPGSVMVVYGRLESFGLGMPETGLLVEAKIGNNVPFYTAQVVTDSNGYFKAGFNVPSASSNVGKKLRISVDGTQRLEYTLRSQADINASENEAFELLGFTAPGYLQGETPRLISAGTTELGMVFSKNVNYFNNKNADADLKNLGVNIKNQDCFRLYKGESGTTKVDIDVDLISSGGDTSVNYTELAGTVSSAEAKDIIYIDLNEALVAGTIYRMVISGDLSSNSSASLLADQTVYFKTATSGGSGSGTGATTGTTTPTGTDTPKQENSITLAAAPVIQGDRGTVSPSDAQITESLKKVAEGQKNVLTLGVSEEDLKNVSGGIQELALALSSSQVESLKEKVDQVVYNTPLGEVVIPREVLAQTKGDISLNVKKTGEEDSFEVTLTDNTGAVRTLRGRVSLVLPVVNTQNNVVLHNGTIMKNAFIENGKMYALTKGFSVFSTGQKTVSFSDVKGHWAAESIDFLAVRGIVSGVSQDTFAPQKTVTRAEFVKMLVGAMDDIDASASASAGYSDVPAGAWYGASVNWAAANGVIKGVGNGRFGSGDAITRQDMAVILARMADALSLELEATKQKTSFSDDSRISEYAKSSVYEMQQAGIISGKGNGTFDPAGYATRAETSAMVTAFIKAMVK